MTTTRPEHATDSAAPRRSLTPLATLACALAMLPIASALVLSAPASAPGTIDPDLVAEALASPGSPLQAFVTLDHETSAADVEALEASGMAVLRVYPGFHLAYGLVDGRDVAGLATLPGVLSLQGNERLQEAGNTATVSTRARDSWDSKSTSTNPTGYDGTGVTVAVVDSGIDATHPDLAPAVVGNLKYICSTPGLVSTASDMCYGNTFVFGTICASSGDGFVALDNTDTSSGHGTHVAGIVAGRGTMSAGRYMGAAPGASLFGFGTGEGLSVLFAVESFHWIFCNGVANGIDIVTNSWGPSSGPYVATDPVNMGANALVGLGMPVFFSAGNEGATGANTVTPYGRGTTQGVITVASSYDGDNGAREDSTVSDFSSRCLATSAAQECPDVTAPGENYQSTQAKTGPAVLALGAGRSLSYQPYYSGIDGTSMATPHVAGIAALLLQANSSLSPADIEDILEDNAVQFEAPATYSITDAANPTTTVSPNSGHGLVDAIASLEDTRVVGTLGLGSPQPQVSQNPHVYSGVAGAGADGQAIGGLQWTLPDGTAATLSERSLTSGDALYAMTALSTPCRFVVFTPSGTATLACTGLGGTMAADTLPAVRMDAPYTFSGTGVYTVEPQVDFGSGYVAIDSFTVTVV